MLWVSLAVPWGFLCGVFEWLLGVSGVSFGVIFASCPWKVSLEGRAASWALRERFPGFSGKFWEAFWLHFGVMFG